jgi:hypothetical protein
VKVAAPSTARLYSTPTITDFGSIRENTFGVGHVFAGGSATLLVHCNSGRGNLSETDLGSHQTNSDTLINPHEPHGNGNPHISGNPHGNPHFLGLGPGDSPTDDCDPGNSGPHNAGGD